MPLRTHFLTVDDDTNWRQLFFPKQFKFSPKVSAQS